MILYSVRAIASGYLIAKFDENFDVEATYEVSPASCTCPAFHRRQTCKHQDILAKFITREKVDTEWFYCREADSWHNPLGLESMPRVDTPEGITVLTLDNPADLHNTLADVFGEPRLESSPPTPSSFRRRI